MKHGGSYIDSADWMKKATINDINGDYKCFQYSTTVTLNHVEIRKYSQRRSKTNPFVNKYN